MNRFNTTMFTGKIIGTATGSIANCPICHGAYRFEIKRGDPEEWRCHTCTKGKWESIMAFEEIIKPTTATKTGEQIHTSVPVVALKAISDAQSALLNEITVSDSPDNVPGYITYDDEVGPALMLLEQSDVWYLDLETFSHELPRNGKDKPATDPFRNKIRLITLSDGQHAFTFDIVAISDPIPIIKAIKGKFIVGHNLKFDLKTIAYKFGRGYLTYEVFDTMLMAALLYHSETTNRIVAGTLGLKSVLEKYLGVEVSKEEQVSNWGAEVLRPEQINYALDDVNHLPALVTCLVSKLNKLAMTENECTQPDKLGLINKVAKIENGCLPILIKAELNGIPINPVIFDNKQMLFQEVHEMETRFTEKYGLKPTQVQKIRAMLNEDFDMELEDMKKTTLEKFKDVVPIGEVIEYRKTVSMLKFLERIAELLKDGKLYTNFKHISAPSGRMSTQPSVQSIPREMKKTVYLPPAGWKLLRGDFPAIELRLAAKKSGEPNLIEAFKNHLDPHRMTASKLSGKPTNDIGDDDVERKTAKACNFGFLYGMGAETFRIYSGPTIGRYLTIEEAEKFRKQFFEAYPTLMKWQKQAGHKLKNLGGKGIASTLYGRKVMVDRYNLALNVPVQGSGADLIKDSLIRFDKSVSETDLTANIINIIHDEIIVLTPENQAEQVATILKISMESAANEMMPEFRTIVEVKIY